MVAGHHGLHGVTVLQVIVEIVELEHATEPVIPFKILIAQETTLLQKTVQKVVLHQVCMLYLSRLVTINMLKGL